MTSDFIYIDKTFQKTVFTDQKVTGREYDGCDFQNCDFQQTHFIDCTFTNCKFTDCNLSMAGFQGSTLQQLTFTRSKLLGIRFDNCNPILFSAEFYESVLDFSWFLGLKLAKTIFDSCSLKGVNFSNADLTMSSFANCNLENAVFENTQLKAADFTSAYNLAIDPEINLVKGARFSNANIAGLLHKYDIRII